MIKVIRNFLYYIRGWQPWSADLGGGKKAYGWMKPEKMKSVTCSTSFSMKCNE